MKIKFLFHIKYARQQMMQFYIEQQENAAGSFWRCHYVSAASSFVMASASKWSVSHAHVQHAYKMATVFNECTKK